MWQNVIYLVCDCLRLDAVTPERTPTLSRLARGNPTFTSCVAPANWSLPSHATIFTGEYPHEHGHYHRGHRMASLPLVDAFADRGYTTVGLTSNIYFSRGQGFDAGFDEFYETRRPLNPRGLNPFSAVRRRQPPDGPTSETYLRVLWNALRHDRPVASLGNYVRAVGAELDRQYDLQRRIPGLDPDRYGFLRHAGDRSQRLLDEILETHATSGDPLFAFVNFMDTHYPYQPTPRHLSNESEDEYDVADLRALDPELGNSWVFLNEHFADRVDETALDIVRTSYYAEVQTLDERLYRLLDYLEQLEIRQETLVVVTSDHGECLGESDPRGERLVGHLGSLNEHLWTVPLILVHPEFDTKTVERPVSLGSLSTALMADAPLQALPDRLTTATDEPVLFEIPANPYQESSYEAHEQIPDWYVHRQTETHTVAGVEGAWLVAAGSEGDLTAWHDGTKRDPDAAPSNLVTACTDAVVAYEDVSARTQDDRLSSGVEQQLKDLGYR